MKKSLNSAFLIVLVWFTISCEANEDQNSLLETVYISVYDADSWTGESNPLETVAGAEINLYLDRSTFDAGAPEHTVSTNENGIATVMIPRPIDSDLDGIYDENTPDFIITVENDGKTNIKNGYMIAGVFFCQSTLDGWNVQAQSSYGSDYQEGATVGGIHYADSNADGIVNTIDQIPYGYITLELEEEEDGPMSSEDPGTTICPSKPTERNVAYIAQ